MISPTGVTKLNNAFTLIEILLVIVIAGIVLALAVPNFSKEFSRLQINKTTNDLLSVDRWAQAMAIGQGRIYALSFAGDNSSYKLLRVKSDDQDATEDNFEPVKGPLGQMHLLPDSVHLDTDAKQIEFYPDGTIDQATIQLIAPNQKIVLSSTQVRGMLTKVDNE